MIRFSSKLFFLKRIPSFFISSALVAHGHTALAQSQPERSVGQGQNLEEDITLRRYANHPAVDAFISEMAARHDFDAHAPVILRPLQSRSCRSRRLNSSAIGMYIGQASWMRSVFAQACASGARIRPCCGALIAHSAYRLRSLSQSSALNHFMATKWAISTCSTR